LAPTIPTDSGTRGRPASGVGEESETGLRAEAEIFAPFHRHYKLWIAPKAISGNRLSVSALSP